MQNSRMALCAFAGALMACSVASLQAAPLPTNVAALKSMTADQSVQVRWGYWHRGSSRARSWEWTQEPAAYDFEHQRSHYGYRGRHWRFL